VLILYPPLCPLSHGQPHELLPERRIVGQPQQPLQQRARQVRQAEGAQALQGGGLDGWVGGEELVGGRSLDFRGPVCGL